MGGCGGERWEGVSGKRWEGVSGKRWEGVVVRWEVWW